ALVLRGTHHGRDRCGGLVERTHLVLDVRTDDTEADRATTGVGGVALPRLEVGGDRQVDRVHDPPHRLQHQVAWDLLTVVVAVHRRDRVAGGRERPGALGLRDDAGTGDVPDVDQGEQGR